MTAAVLGGLASVALAAGAAACSSGSAPADAGSASTFTPGPEAGSDPYAAADDDSGPPPTFQPTYTAVWNEILSPTCALVFCHTGDQDFLELPNKDLGYASLLAPASGPECAPTGFKRVEPGNPDASLLYLKITTPPCGGHMPLYYVQMNLDPAEVTQIHDWIAAGAKND